jgi:ABC-type transport system involved in multi-copper enzyme maturation permease subunit
LIIAAIVANTINSFVQMFGYATEGYAEEYTGDTSDEGTQYDQTPVSTDGSYVSYEYLDGAIQTTQALYDDLKEREKSDSKLYSEMKVAKSTLVVLKYAKAHGYYNKKVRILGVNFSFSSLNGETFVTVYCAIISLIVLIYGAVLGGNMYVNEYKSGTIKLIMTRPITKNRMTLVKLLALYTTEAILFLVPALIGYAYGAVAFGTDSAVTFLYSFDSLAGGVSTVGAFTFARIIMMLVEIMVISTISFCLGTVTRKPALGIIVVIAILLGVGNLLNLIDAGAFLLGNSFGLLNFFSPGATVLKYGDFFLSLGVMVFWTALALAASFIVVNRRDVI